MESMKITTETYFIREQIVKRGLVALMDLSPKQVQTIVNLMKECQDQRKLIELYDKDHPNEIRILTNEPLLTIELEDEQSVPKVYYKGKELTKKTKVSFEWLTKSEHAGTGGINLFIERHDEQSGTLNVIGKRNGEYR